MIPFKRLVAISAIVVLAPIACHKSNHSDPAPTAKQADPVDGLVVPADESGRYCTKAWYDEYKGLNDLIAKNGEAMNFAVDGGTYEEVGTLAPELRKRCQAYIDNNALSSCILSVTVKGEKRPVAKGQVTNFQILQNCKIMFGTLKTEKNWDQEPG